MGRYVVVIGEQQDGAHQDREYPSHQGSCPERLLQIWIIRGLYGQIGCRQVGDKTEREQSDCEGKWGQPAGEKIRLQPRPACVDASQNCPEQHRSDQACDRKYPAPPALSLISRTEIVPKCKGAASQDDADKGETQR